MCWPRFVFFYMTKSSYAGICDELWNTLLPFCIELNLVKYSHQRMNLYRNEAKNVKEWQNFNLRMGDGTQGNAFLYKLLTVYI